jgi:hypothetical protein
MVRFTDQKWPSIDNNWSLVVNKIKTLANEYQWMAQVCFLVPEAPLDTLIEGREFELYEGNKLVAFGVICSD